MDWVVGIVTGVISGVISGLFVSALLGIVWGWSYRFSQGEVPTRIERLLRLLNVKGP